MCNGCCYCSSEQKVFETSSDDLISSCRRSQLLGLFHRRQQVRVHAALNLFRIFGLPISLIKQADISMYVGITKNCFYSCMPLFYTTCSVRELQIRSVLWGQCSRLGSSSPLSGHGRYKKGTRQSSHHQNCYGSAQPGKDVLWKPRYFHPPDRLSTAFKRTFPRFDFLAPHVTERLVLAARSGRLQQSEQRNIITNKR